MKLLGMLSCQVTILGGEPTGRFEHPPEPTAENLASVCQRVVAAKADVGFCQDPDADRLAIIDERGRYIGEEYTLLLVPRDAVPLPLTVADVEFLRQCLDNAGHRWREAITDAAAGADGPPQSHPAEPGHLHVEPTPAGYRAARRRFTDELDRVERLTRLLDRHLNHATAADPDGGQP